MTATCREIGLLILRVQDAFIETPGLALTPPAARRRFGLDAVTCDAALAALADANVVARTSAGADVRQQPRRVARAA